MVERRVAPGQSVQMGGQMTGGQVGMIPSQHHQMHIQAAQQIGVEMHHLEGVARAMGGRDYQKWVGLIINVLTALKNSGVDFGGSNPPQPIDNPAMQQGSPEQGTPQSGQSQKPQPQSPQPPQQSQPPQPQQPQQPSQPKPPKQQQQSSPQKAPPPGPPDEE